jgi:WD40 repeat protein
LILRGHKNRVYAAGFSPNGARIVSGSEDGTVRMWDTVSGEQLLVLSGHYGLVHAAAFSPDGRRVVSGGFDGSVLLWFVGKNDADLAAHACPILPRDLSAVEIRRFNLDPNVPWPCAKRARTLWPHPVEAAIASGAGPE